MIVLADVGHSCIKLSRYLSAGRIGEVFSVQLNSSWKEELNKFLVRADEIEELIIASVNPQLNEELIALLGERYPFYFVRTEQVPMPTNYNKNRLGVDRLLACYGAWKIYKQDLVVVDAGTMVTVDWVRDGGHLGGVILPGIGLLCSYYSQHLPVEKNKVFSEGLSGLACNTEQAIRQGMEKIYQFIADIQELIIVTGGEGKCLVNLVLKEKDALYEENLVLKGLAYCMSEKYIFDNN